MTPPRNGQPHNEGHYDPNFFWKFVWRFTGDSWEIAHSTYLIQTRYDDIDHGHEIRHYMTEHRASLERSERDSHCALRGHRDEYE